MTKKYFYTEVAKEDCDLRMYRGYLERCKLTGLTCTDPSKCQHGKEIKDIKL